MTTSSRPSAAIFHFCNLVSTSAQISLPRAVSTPGAIALIFPLSSAVVGDGVDQIFGNKREKERDWDGRENGCELRWCRPPEDVGVRRKRRPVLDDAMYV